MAIIYNLAGKKRDAQTIEGVLDDEFLARRAMLNPPDDDFTIPFDTLYPLEKPRAAPVSPLTVARGATPAGFLHSRRAWRTSIRTWIEAAFLGLLCWVVIFIGLAL